MNKIELNVSYITPLLHKLRKDDRHFFLLVDFNMNVLKYDIAIMKLSIIIKLYVPIFSVLLLISPLLSFDSLA